LSFPILLSPARLFLNAVPRTGGEIIVRVTGNRLHAALPIWVLVLTVVAVHPLQNPAFVFKAPETGRWRPKAPANRSLPNYGCPVTV
jgi:hypothetical protein